MSETRTRWSTAEDVYHHKVWVIGEFMAHDGKITEIRRSASIRDINTGISSISRLKDEVIAEFEFNKKYGWLKSL